MPFLLSDCGPVYKYGLRNDSYSYSNISSSKIAYCRPVVAKSLISYVNKHSYSGFKDTEVSGTGESFYREFKYAVNREGLGWIEINGSVSDRIYSYLSLMSETFEGLNDEILGLLREKQAEFIVLVYDMNLTHLHTVSSSNLGGAVYGAEIDKSLVFRCSVVDVSGNRPLLNVKIAEKIRGGSLGLMEKAVKELFSILLGE